MFPARPRVLGLAGHPTLLVDDAELSEPGEPPPYLLHDGRLPDEARDHALRFGYGGGTPEDVAEVTWRQPLQHVEMPSLVSAAVFDALVGIAPDAFEEYQRVVIHEPNGSSVTREYVGFRTHHLAAGPDKGVLREACEPPIGPDTTIHVAVREQLKMGVSPVLAFSRSIARADALLAGNYWYVTEEFREAWLATEISKYMRSTNGEYDFAFSPGVLWFGGDNMGKDALEDPVVRYRWVDDSAGST